MKPVEKMLKLELLTEVCDGGFVLVRSEPALMLMSIYPQKKKKEKRLWPVGSALLNT